MPDVEDASVIPKQEDFRDVSSGSSADSVGEVDGEADGDGNVNAPPVVPQKRKGGRKPIYATSEERKQRNRQAQAAFRERRTEYIKQLEATIKRQDESLQSLQQSHRTAADECLMLRYKNSLLERVLLEKGIDVQAELRRKEIAPPTRLPQNLPQPTPISRPSNRGRHYPKLSSGSAVNMQKTLQSPGAMSTQSSQVSSPIKSPGYGTSAGISIPHTGYQSPQSTQSIHSRTGAGRSSLKHIAPNPGTVPGPGHWPSPFQSHREQLEEEYGSTAEMIDVDDNEDIDPGPGPYPQPLSQTNYSMASRNFAMPVTSGTELGQQGVGYSSQGYSTSTTMLDADPFGLNASMHFPTPFTYQESSRRK